MLSLIMA